MEVEYDVSLVDRIRHGKGTMAFPNSDKYIVEWNYSKLNGQGTVTYTNGAKYVGEWKDGKRHGRGTMTFTNGIKYTGEWKDDIFISKSKPYFANVIPCES